MNASIVYLLLGVFNIDITTQSNEITFRKQKAIAWNSLNIRIS